jgi:hypothetical protein
MYRLFPDLTAEVGQRSSDLGLLRLQPDAERADDGLQAFQGRAEGARPGDGG